MIWSDLTIAAGALGVEMTEMDDILAEDRIVEGWQGLPRDKVRNGFAIQARRNVSMRN